jgi:hypothetical protein
MEPEGSLPQSQMPATCPYPEPDQSQLTEVNLNIIIPSTPGLPIGLFLLRFHHQKACIRLSFPPHLLHASPT